MISTMSEEAIRSEWVGQVIDGRFTLLQWLGGSGRSGVFLTELPGTPGKKAAIKLIEADAEDADAIVAGWSIVIDFSHPHLMRLLHTGRCRVDGSLLIYAVSECADEVLAEILQERALTSIETKEMIEPIVDTLLWLHGRGLVHGRLKPSNILVVEDELKLSGDCIHGAGLPGTHFQSAGIYTAPETAGGVTTPAADVWSLGVTLVEALTQRRPTWDGTSGEATIPDSIAQPFAGIARGCLQADPADRCTVADVKLWLNKTAVPGEYRGGPPEKQVTGKIRGPLLMAATVAVVAVIAVFAIRSHQSPSEAPAAAQQQVQQDAPAPVAAQPQAQAQTPPSATNQASAPVATPARDQAAAVPAAAPQPAGSDPQAPKPQAPTRAQQTPAPAPQAPPSQAERGLAPTGSAANSDVVNRVIPDVLPSAARSIRGKINVKVRVSVDPSGNVASADFESEGPSKYFSKAAMDAAQKWKFKPAEANGQAAASEWILQFQFSQDGTDVIPVQAH